MNELEEQKKDLRVALAAVKLKEDLALKKEHIVFFLHQFAGMDYSDIECQKRLIKTFLNSVFVYDDKAGSGDSRYRPGSAPGHKCASRLSRRRSVTIRISTLRFTAGHRAENAVFLDTFEFLSQWK